MISNEFDTAFTTDTDTLDVVSKADRAADMLTEHRASGNCAPPSWGFLLDAQRTERLAQMIEAARPLPAWARRECQRLLVSTRTLPGKPG